MASSVITWNDGPITTYTASDLKPQGVTFDSFFKKKDPRPLFLEPDTADSQCIDSGAGDKPTDEIWETCYICGYKITDKGSSGTDVVSPCFTGADGEFPVKDMSTLTEDELSYVANHELIVNKQKMYRPWRGWRSPHDLKDDTEAPVNDRRYMCGNKRAPVYYAKRECNIPHMKGEPCKTQKKYRIYRKNKAASPCGSQCEHVLPIVTLAFLCGLKLDNFDKLIQGILNDTCAHNITPQMAQKMRLWRNGLHGLAANGAHPPQPADPDLPTTGVVYLWAHPYCNQFKDCHPFVNVDFDLDTGPVATVNEHNIQFILRVLQGKILTAAKKNLPLRSGWWNCISNEDLDAGDHSSLSDEWLQQRVTHLTAMMTSLTGKIMEPSDIERKLFSSVCIQAVKQNILLQMSKYGHGQTLSYTYEMEELVRKASLNIGYTSGGGLLSGASQVGGVLPVSGHIINIMNATGDECARTGIEIPTVTLEQINHIREQLREESTRGGSTLIRKRAAEIIIGTAITGGSPKKRTTIDPEAPIKENILKGDNKYLDITIHHASELGLDELTMAIEPMPVEPMAVEPMAVEPPEFTGGGRQASDHTKAQRNEWKAMRDVVAKQEPDPISNLMNESHIMLNNNRAQFYNTENGEHVMPLRGVPDLPAHFPLICDQCEKVIHIVEQTVNKNRSANHIEEHLAENLCAICFKAVVNGAFDDGSDPTTDLSDSDPATRDSYKQWLQDIDFRDSGMNHVHKIWSQKEKEGTLINTLTTSLIWYIEMSNIISEAYFGTSSIGSRIRLKNVSARIGKSISKHAKSQKAKSQRAKSRKAKSQKTLTKLRDKARLYYKKKTRRRKGSRRKQETGRSVKPKKPKKPTKKSKSKK